VWETLADDPMGWLPPPAWPCDGGWLVELDATGPLPAALARRLARVWVGPSYGDAAHLFRTLEWHAATATQLFPMLDADLKWVPLDKDVSQLSLLGTYRPPLSVVGDLGDAALGHRVAEACVRQFVLDVAARVEQERVRG
jgi:hypothetical protein